MICGFYVFCVFIMIFYLFLIVFCLFFFEISSSLFFICNFSVLLGIRNLLLCLMIIIKVFFGKFIFFRVFVLFSIFIVMVIFERLVFIFFGSFILKLFLVFLSGVDKCNKCVINEIFVFCIINEIIVIKNMILKIIFDFFMFVIIG